MRRILVVGCPGAGKSTFARRLGDAWGLPVIHLDRLWWKSGWQSREEADFDADLETALAGEAWIIDGDYARTLASRLRRAEAVFWLRYSRWRCWARVLRRRWHFRGGRVRPDMAPECPEQWDADFFRYIGSFERKQTPRMEAALREAVNLSVTVFRTPRDAERFLSTIDNREHECPI